MLDNPFYAESAAPRRIRLPELEPLSRADQDAVANPITQNWKDDAGEGTYFYDPFTVLCDATQCPLEQDGKVLYLDNNHLSMVGVRLLEPSLIAIGQSNSWQLGKHNCTDSRLTYTPKPRWRNGRRGGLKPPWLEIAV